MSNSFVDLARDRGDIRDDVPFLQSCGWGHNEMRSKMSIDFNRYKIHRTITPDGE